METSLKYQKTLQFDQVYITDMGSLQEIFFQVFSAEAITPAYGVPFLLAKKKGKIVGFASLVLNSQEKIDFEIYTIPAINADEKEIFVSFVNRYIQEKHSINPTNPEELKNNINRIINWLN